MLTCYDYGIANMVGYKMLLKQLSLAVDLMIEWIYFSSSFGIYHCYRVAHSAA